MPVSVHSGLLPWSACLQSGRRAGVDCIFRGPPRQPATDWDLRDGV